MIRLEFIKHRGEEYKYSPAFVRDTCGCEFYLEDQYLGACECPKCGQWFNLFGQTLTNPTNWNDNCDW